MSEKKNKDANKPVKKEEKISLSQPEEKKKTWKYYIGFTAALCGAAMIVWPLFGLLAASLSGTEFVYSLKDYLLHPLLFGVLLGAYNFHVDVNRN